MKILIALNQQLDETEIESVRQKFLTKFKNSENYEFVYDNPDVIFFKSGGSENNAIANISSGKRYCLIADKENNSWAAASEVKAYLNEKGVKSKIFDFDSIDNLNQVEEFLNYKQLDKLFNLGLVGGNSDWLIASNADSELLEHVLNIKLINIDLSELNEVNLSESTRLKSKNPNDLSIPENCEVKLSQIEGIITKYSLNAIALNCFKLLNEQNITPCIPFAIINSENIPAICEGDLCSAAGMIVGRMLLGEVPWMANIIHVDRKYASFAHCTAPISFLEDYKLVKHFESGKGYAIKGKIPNQKVTVFRIDKNLEKCFIAIGEICDSYLEGDICTNSVKISLSQKSLFLLKEFPLGNHHLIVKGDQSDILARFFTERGFMIF